MSGASLPDVSKYFPYASGLLAEFNPDAVVLLVVGGTVGSGCAPALVLDREDTPAARQRNARIVRGVVRSLLAVAEQLERDVARSGVPLEPKS